MFFDYRIPDALDLLSYGSHTSPARPQASGPGGMLRCPGPYLASPLFAAQRFRRQRAGGSTTLATLEDAWELLFTGERLDQDDLDVLLGCVEMAIERQRPGSAVRFAVPDFLHRLGRRVSGRSRDRLAASLLRIEHGRLSLCGQSVKTYTQLLSTVVIDQERDICQVEVNPEVVAAVAAMPSPLVFIHDRLRLGPRPLAKWLLGLIWTLKDEYTLDEEELLRLCGRPSPGRQPLGTLLHKALFFLGEMGYAENITEYPDGRIGVRGLGGASGPARRRRA
ncbi:hypothetical protein dsx2_1711 [Desulfovibrio sp. X2]|uniref:hypothetical protein n=1 Tax=Desulfovibrio sp. X2 TaxID=941449 RepID=UPI000358D78F|nr:hypothetical protein [Desulfovibrio sp. X2]EPR44350.1 hypothetical protein dsx2_1711 [Desulfovibrio sp. X2]